MRSSRLSRRERCSSSLRASHASSAQFAGSILALGALASASHIEAAKADGSPNVARVSSSSARLGIAPSVTIVQPSYSDLIKGTTQVVIAIDAKSASTRSVEMFVDGVSATNGAQSLPGLNSAQFDWRTTTVKDGLHRLTVRVTDENGLRGEADTQVYINNSRTRDTKAPTLQWQNVRSGDLLHGETKLQLDANDNFGVKYIVITVNPVDQPTRTPALRASLINRAPFEYSLDTTRLPDGVYVLSARGYDVLDNEGATQSVTFGVSNNGLNPTVLERLNDVLDAQKTVAETGSSPRSRVEKSPVLTNARPKIESKKSLASPAKPAPQLTNSPKIVASKTTPFKAAAHAPEVKVEVKPALVKLPPSKAFTVKTITVKAPVVKTAVNKTQIVKTQIARLPANSASIALARPSISTPTLTVAHSASASEAQKMARFDGVNATNKPSSSNEAVSHRLSPRVFASRVAESRVAESRVAALPRAERNVAATKAAVANVSFMPIASVTTPELSLSKALVTTAVTTSNDSTTQRAAKPSTALRLAQANVRRTAAPAFSSEKKTSEVGLTAVANSQALAMASASVSSRDFEYSMSPRATSGRVALRARTPQRMAALPTRRDHVSLSNPLSEKLKSGAAITVSPLTMAAMQDRGATEILPATHVVKKGETLSTLASRYGLRAATLASVNSLKLNANLVVGQKLNLPRALKVSYQGQSATGDSQAMMIGDVSAAPFRFLFEQQGGTMKWDEAAQRVTAINGTRRVSITIGSREASVGDQKVMMDLAAFLLSGRTMVPVRFFEQAFDTKVEWEPATSRIYVAMSNDRALIR